MGPAPQVVEIGSTLRLAKYFEMSDSFWIDLQARYDLEVDRNRLADELEKVPVYSA